MRQWIAAVAAGLVAGAAWLHGHGVGAAGVQARWDAERAQQAQADLAASEQAREIEQTRRMAQERVVDARRAEIAKQDRSSAALADVAGRLRQHVALLAARGAADDPAAADGSTAAAGPGLVLSDLYRGVDEEAAELAAAYDRARSAGLACQRLYDTLSP